MRLEEASSLLDRAFALDRLLAKAVYEVTPTQALILAFIDGPTPVTLMRYWGTNPTWNVDALCRRGYVAKTQDRADERRTIVALTPKGAALADRIRKVIGGAPSDG